MKTIAILMTTIIISQSVNAARSCKSYITDDWTNSRYNIETISGDNVVTDNKTGLMWKQCSEGLYGSDCMIGSISPYKWDIAISIPNTLNSSVGLAGFTDWRLPNIAELRSIAAINCFNPSINETAFPNTPPFSFWSDSPHAINDNVAWSVSYSVGSSSIDDRSGRHYVRLVRNSRKK